MTTKSAKHANKTFGSAKDTAAKAVDMHKVAALSAGAASVIAGAAIAFGATPAMAAEVLLLRLLKILILQKSRI